VAVRRVAGWVGVVMARYILELDPFKSLAGRADRREQSRPNLQRYLTGRTTRGLILRLGSSKHPLMLGRPVGHSEPIRRTSKDRDAVPRCGTRGEAEGL